jgi:hypothetical protein
MLVREPRIDQRCEILTAFGRELETLQDRIGSRHPIAGSFDRFDVEQAIRRHHGVVASARVELCIELSEQGQRSGGN